MPYKSRPDQEFFSSLNTLGIGLMYGFLWYFLSGYTLPDELTTYAVFPLTLAMNLAELVVFALFAIRPLSIRLPVLCIIYVACSISLLLLNFSPFSNDATQVIAVISGALVGLSCAATIINRGASVAKLGYENIQKSVALAFVLSASIFLLLMTIARPFSNLVLAVVPLMLLALHVIIMHFDSNLVDTSVQREGGGVIPGSFLLAAFVSALANGYFHGLGVFTNHEGTILLFAGLVFGCTLMTFARTLKTIFLLALILGAAGLNLMITQFSSIGVSLVGLGHSYYLVIAWVVCAALTKKDKAHQGMVSGRIWLVITLGQTAGVVSGFSTNSISEAGVPEIGIIAPLAIALLILLSLALFANKPFLFVLASEVRNVEQRSDYLAKITLLEKKHGLTPREQEVFEMLAFGRNSKSIEEELSISRNTVKTHIRNIYLKLGVASQQDLLSAVENTKL